jgi:riboflavin synthase
MFTGIIESTGKVVGKHPQLEIAAPTGDLTPGESIAVNGVCVTVTSASEESFTADLSEETLERSSLGSLDEGARVNLERPMAAGGRFGGHVVQGHVDGIGRVSGLRRMAGSTEMSIWTSRDLMRYVVEKGSIAVDGVSLTVTSIKADEFSVSLIPHTLEATNLGDRREGDQVNIEVDILAKYVEKLTEKSR